MWSRPMLALAAALCVGACVTSTAGAPTPDLAAQTQPGGPPQAPPFLSRDEWSDNSRLRPAPQAPDRFALALDAGARAPDETALMTTELVPDHADDVPQREREFGASRVACNALWYSDVNAGRIISGATIARLRAEPDFAAVRAENAQSDAAFCAAEAASLRPAPAALR